MKVQAKVFSRRGVERIERTGRGFSQSELGEVGLSLEKGKSLGLAIDPKRSTKHAHNIQVLKDWIEASQAPTKK